MLNERQDTTIVDGRPPPNGQVYYWWYSPTAYVVRWLVLSGIFLLFFTWITFGYYHARRRLRKGLRPLAYHRWLVPKSQRAPKPQNTYNYYRQEQQSYNMQNFQEPPPVYTRGDQPPSYQTPPGEAKGGPTEPEPSHLPPQQSGTI